MNLQEAAQLALDEAIDATTKFGPMVSTHHGYALLLEELDELWEHVKRKKNDRSKILMRMEAVQIAAMAMCFAAQLCGDDYDGL